jgi:hypothetical protein
MDGRPIDSAGSGSAAMLTVKNYLSWCSVAIGTGTASTSASQSVPITSNGAIMLAGSPASSSFALGSDMWHHTDGDTGSGEAGTVSGTTSTARVTVSTTASKCVWVCCPFTNGTGCPTADQCP